MPGARRIAVLAAEEKGLAYSLVSPAIDTDAYQALHPFGKMPAMTHGDVQLFETFAITRYFDEGFDGPALQPADKATRARMTQWVSAYVDHMYATIVRGLIVPRLVFPQRGVPVDEDGVVGEVGLALAYKLPVARAGFRPAAASGLRCFGFFGRDSRAWESCRRATRGGQPNRGTRRVAPQL